MKNRFIIVLCMLFIPCFFQSNAFAQKLEPFGLQGKTVTALAYYNGALYAKDILFLAQERRNPKILYAGTTNGIFRFEAVPTNVWQGDKGQKQIMPKNFKLYPAYPNPF